MVKLYRSGGEARLACPLASKEEGHKADVNFVWQDGSEHVDHHQRELTCNCGRLLVHVAGADPWKHPSREVEGTPHGA